MKIDLLEAYRRSRVERRSHKVSSRGILRDFIDGEPTGFFMEDPLWIEYHPQFFYG